MITSISIIIILNLLLLFIQSSISKPCTDHPYHLKLINGIRDNKHRFLKQYPNVIGEENFGYPQLIHWILSFLPKSFMDKYYSGVAIIINNLSLALFLIYTIWVFYISESNMAMESFILYAGLIYILTPFSWSIWNSKNNGINARGFGLLLGYIYQFLILLYFYSGSWIILFPIFLIVFIILLSSQFALQFVLLTLPFYAIVYSNYYILTFPILAFLLFYLIMKDIALNFIKGQYWHKTIYYKYLAKVYILKMRPSIWYDLVFDIWKQIIKDPKRGILYAYHNPIISIIIAIPALAYLLFHFLGNNHYSVTKIESVLYYNIIIVLIVFLLTSLRKTRFLGEPERYVELAIPNIILLTLFVNNESNSDFKIILIISSVLVAFQFLILFLKNKRSMGIQLSAFYQQITDVIMKINKEHHDLRVFSNNHQILKTVLETEAKVLLTNLTSFYTGSVSFTDLFPERYGKISGNVIVGLITEFDINCFILDPLQYRSTTIPNFKKLHFTEYFVSKDFIVYIKRH